MSGPAVRTARPHDDAALRALDRQVWSPRHSRGPRPSGDEPVVDTGRTCLVAELDGEVVGYVSLSRATPLVSNAHVAMIDGMAVRPQARGSGVGAQLLEAALEHARHRAARRVRLRVLATNGPARRLYERHGFVVEGVLEGEFHLGGQDVDDVLMARSVRPR